MVQATAPPSAAACHQPRMPNTQPPSAALSPPSEPRNFSNSDSVFAGSKCLNLSFICPVMPPILYRKLSFIFETPLCAFLFATSPKSTPFNVNQGCPLPSMYLRKGILQQLEGAWWHPWRRDRTCRICFRICLKNIRHREVLAKFRFGESWNLEILN